MTHDGHAAVITETPAQLPWRAALPLSLAAVAAFHVAYAFRPLSFLIVVYFAALFYLARIPQRRFALYVGLGIGLLIAAPHLGFFWTIFGPLAIPLWLGLAFWTGVFLLVARLAVGSAGRWVCIALIPTLWMGLEYFRSELYYLRFAWLLPVHALAPDPPVFLARVLGVYGFGFAVMLAFGVLTLLRGRAALLGGGLLLAGLAAATNLTVRAGPREAASVSGPFVAGVQLETPTPFEVIARLDRVVAARPEAELLVLPEYTFNGPVPPRVCEWCRANGRYLVAGGVHYVQDPPRAFRNTAFVVGPDGEIVFEQAKSVPIQFFRDGLPAARQEVWQSPWGPIGICVCYDLGYARVTDNLIRQGAQAIVCPVMDVEAWGRHEHALHGRVGPLRAAEYGVPILRACSSGISQLIDGRGHVLASAPFPGQGEFVAGRLPMRIPGRLPADRYVAPVAAIVTAVFILWRVAAGLRAAMRRRRTAAPLAAS